MNKLKNKYIRFLTKLILLFLILALFDIVLGKIFDFTIFHLKGGIQASTTYAIHQADQQLIILGSSRAEHHYVPSIFDDTLKLKSYNAGCDGMTFLYYLSVFKSILSREKPKAVIVDLLPDEFTESSSTYTSLASLLPYYYSDPSIQPILNLRSPYEKVKTVSNIYRYNSIIGPLLRDIFFNSPTSDDGYVPLYGKLNQKASLGFVHPANNDIDTIIVDKFRQMIKEAKENDCQLFVFISPTYQNYKYTHETIRIASEICEKENVYFHDFSRDSLFWNHPNYFANTFHLNDTGAKVYSKILAKKVKEDLSKELFEKQALKLEAINMGRKTIK